MPPGDLELDHVLVWVGRGAPEAERLIDFGLTEGTPNVHRGQGTAIAASSSATRCWSSSGWTTRRRRGASRPAGSGSGSGGYRETGASPFGLCVRRPPEAAGPLPFETWAYRPAYLPAGVAIDMAATSERAEEPLVFAVTSGGRPDAQPASRRQPLAHRAGFREVSAVRISGPDAPSPSATGRAIEATTVATVGRGAGHRMARGFDGERHGRSADFRPDLPLVFHW